MGEVIAAARIRRNDGGARAATYADHNESGRNRIGAEFREKLAREEPQTVKGKGRIRPELMHEHSLLMR